MQWQFIITLWNSLPVCVLIRLAVALTHSLILWIIVEAAAGQSYDCSQSVGPETLLHSLSALRNPRGMSALRENRPRRKNAEEEEEVARIEEGEKRRV